MKRKFSAGLGALMVLLITGSALAASGGSFDSGSSSDSGSTTLPITTDGTYDLSAGTYTGKLMDLDAKNLQQDADVILNIENQDTLAITDSNSQHIININNTSLNTKYYNATVNGDLDISMPDIQCQKALIQAINIEAGNKLNINGNLAIKNFNVNNDHSTTLYGINVDQSHLEVQHNFSIENMQINYQRSDTSAYIMGINNNNNNNDSDTSEIILGTDNNDSIKVKNISVTNTGSDLFVYAVDSESKNTTTTLNGSTTINNLTANTQDADAYIFGLFAASDGEIWANGDLQIKNLAGSTTGSGTTLVKAIVAGDGGRIYVNPQKNRTVQIEGDISTIFEDDDNPNIVQLNLTNADSYIHGAIDGNIDLYMANNAVWKVQHGVSTGDGLEHHLKSLTGNGGIIEMDIDASKNTDNPHLFVQNLEGTHTLKLNNTSSSSDISGSEGSVLVTAANGSGNIIAPASEGSLYWTTYELATKDSETANYKTDWYLKKTGKTPVDPVDPVDPSDPSDPGKPHYTTSVSTLLSTITAGYDTWRSDTDKLSERLGELRLNGKDTEGVWVRTKGSKFGRHGGNGSYNNQQHTYQLGYDAVTSKNADQTTYTGFAAEYGKGNLSFDRGTGTMKSAGFGLYQTQLRESGHYLDFVYKFDKYKNDFHVADTAGNPISGKYSNNAMSLSAEYGRQNALKHGWYVEPQAALTLGYMWGNDFTTSNNIRVEQKNMPALIGRLGLNIGRSVSDKVNFYIKANINHDFLGKYDMQMTDLTNGDRLNASDKFASSWFDYGAGFTVKTTNNSYAYFDIERAVGGEYKKNWDWNVGLRWSF